MQRRLAWLALIYASIVWGGNYASVRFLVGYVTPTELIIYRFVPTAFILLIFMLVFHRKEFMRVLPRMWKIWLGISIVWLAGYHLALNTSLTVVPAAPAGIIVSCFPIITMILASIFLSEKFTTGKLTGAAIAFSGCIILATFGSGGD